MPHGELWLDISKFHFLQAKNGPIASFDNIFSSISLFVEIRVQSWQKSPKREKKKELD